MVHAVHVSNLPGTPDDSIAWKLEIRRVEETLYRRLRSGEQIRIDFTKIDFERVTSGNSVTKVVYIPAASSGEKLTFKVLASLSDDDGKDVVAAAERQGKVIAVVRTMEKTDTNERSNTPTVLAALRGRWQELEHKEGEEFNQTLVFSGGALGQWYERAGTLPISITYYVEGTELVLQFYHEPEAAYDYRLKQRRFDYKLDGDTLSLTREGVTTHFQRIREPSPAKTPDP